MFIRGGEVGGDIFTHAPFVLAEIPAAAALGSLLGYFLICTNLESEKLVPNKKINN